MYGAYDKYYRQEIRDLFEYAKFGFGRSLTHEGAEYYRRYYNTLVILLKGKYPWDLAHHGFHGGKDAAGIYSGSKQQRGTQHWLVRAETEHLIHPSIPLPRDQPRVADIGSGTCIWPIELSKLLPASAKIHAFDVSATLYPPVEWLPSNVSLHVHDAFTAFPEESWGTYDVIHLRFFVTVIKDNDPGILLANIVKLLKPGGYLQWVEANPLAATVVKARPSIDASAVMNMQIFLARPRVDATYRWITDLGPSLEQHGLGEITSETFSTTDVYRSSWNDSHLLLYKELLSQLQMGGSSEDITTEAARHYRSLDKVEQELASGVSIHGEFVCVTGKKL